MRAINYVDESNESNESNKIHQSMHQINLAKILKNDFLSQSSGLKRRRR
jgi:ABC-type transport system involved in cytochrome c biogenesis ATPase subunit